MPLANVQQYVNLVLGYTYLVATTPVAYVRPAFVPSTAPSARHITIPTDPKQDPMLKVHCGTCDQPAYAHPYVIVEDTAFGPEPYVICDRLPQEILNSVTASDWLDTADYDTRTGLSVLDSDYSNAYLERGSDLDEYDYESYDSQWESVDRYRDNHPDEYTSALNCWQDAVSDWSATMLGITDRRKVYVYPIGCKQSIGNVPGRYLDADQSRNVYFPTEDSHAGITVKAYDPDLTELYANRMLNFYVDKRTGMLRVGGVELHRDYAQCVQHNCKATLKVTDYDVTNEDGTPNWEAREQYVLDIIRHGNNHAAGWFVNRPEYYKVHTDYCDLACDPKAAHCGTIEQVVERSLNLLASVLNTSKVA